jgi:hypothetical protein
MKLTHSIFALAIMALGLAACATEPRETMSLADRLATRNYLLGEEVKRIRDYRINGWNHVDDYHVIITAGVRDEYLVALRNRCPELRSATHLAFSTTAGSLTEFDKLMVSTPGGGVDRCYVSALYKLAKKPRAAPEQ